MAQTTVEGEEHRNWAMEIYQDKGKRDPLEEVGENILELDLGDVDEELVKKHLAIAVYYTCKLEFRREEEKVQVIEGGPWRHKGDALIVMHYDGFSRLSKIQVENIALLIQLYNLPLVMMKESVARMLGEQLGSFIKMDCSFLAYMRVRVGFPLSKALVS
jgi:hypothetical protein